MGERLVGGAPCRHKALLLTILMNSVDGDGASDPGDICGTTTVGLLKEEWKM